MAEKTKIAWTDHTFNCWIGCTKYAEGCKFCYAEELMANRYKQVEWGPQGVRKRTSVKYWHQPLKWDKDAQLKGEKRKVFCASLADVFEDKPEVVEWRKDLFALIDKCPNLYWLLLTKRPENIPLMWPEDNAYRENVWLGTSIALQRNVEEVLPPLLKVKYLAKYLFLSIEPQIGHVDLKDYLFPTPLVDWVIVGGESKQGAYDPRPYDIDWARFLIEQCKFANIPCFVKQFGSIVYDKGIKVKFSTSHADIPEEWPEETRVRECPEAFEFARG